MKTVATPEALTKLPLSAVCHALALNRSSVYHRRRAKQAADPDRRRRKRAPQPRALTPDERQTVRDLLHSEAYCDQPPAQVYQHLLEQGRFLCSISTMHRLLRDHGEHGERRQQRPAQHHAVPRLQARGPNEVWTWDITKLPTQHRGQSLSLYVILDLYSRYVLAWMVSTKENSALAQQLIKEASARYRITPGQLTLHQDRGSPMIAQGFLDLLAELDVTASHSRPRVSNDNPFSEAQFKTLKYQPDYPGRFDDPGHARRWCSAYFPWYNHDHHHSGLAGFTPEQLFTGRYLDVAAAKQAALDAAYAATPTRFVKGPPKVALPPAVVSINPLNPDDLTDGESLAVNFPTLTRSGRKSELTSN